MRTPLVPFGTVPGADGPRVLLKAESLQPIGAFKIRGAYHAIASLSAGERARGVVTHSSGNHAQGVARAARLLGNAGRRSSCRRTRPRSSAGGSRRTAPRSSPSGPASERARRRWPSALADGAGPDPHPAVRRRPDHRRPGHARARDRRGRAGSRRRAVPIGGGGLSSGVAVAVRALHPNARIIGVEPELAADARDRCARAASCAGTRTRIEPHDRRRRRGPGDRSRGPSPTSRGSWTTS